MCLSNNSFINKRLNPISKRNVKLMILLSIFRCLAMYSNPKYKPTGIVAKHPIMPSWNLSSGK